MVVKDVVAEGYASYLIFLAARPNLWGASGQEDCRTIKGALRIKNRLVPMIPRAIRGGRERVGPQGCRESAVPE